MRHPAAPYYEHAVRAEVERICRENGLACQRDRVGNVLVRLRTAKRRRPIVLAAHMDHPGFEILRPLSVTRWLAQFRGGVNDGYFRKGTRVRLLPGNIPSVLGSKQGKDKTFELKAAASPGTAGLLPKFAIWDLEDFAVRQRRIYGRSCDDLIGVAAALATLIELKKSRTRVNVIAVISRAEEIGFRGALACAASGDLPKNSLVISLETSRELPGVKMGQGVILRVGDRTSIFNPEATRFLAEVALELTAKRKGFEYQRGLMSGGTCEATAYQEFGFQTAAVCVALGNYHNCAARERIKTEYVNISDVSSMVELLVAAAKRMSQYSYLTSKLPRRLRQMLRESDKRLRNTADS